MRRGYSETAVGQIHYCEAGTGEPLLLLGSAGRSSRIFVALQRELAPYKRVLAPDLPGFGASAPMPPGATIEMLSDLMAAFLDQVDAPSAVVYGLHTGNKIATAMAVRHAAKVEKLIIAGQTHSLIPENAIRNAGIAELISSYVTLERTCDHERGERRKLTERIAALLALAPLDQPHPHLGGLIGDHIQDEIEARATPALYRANLAYDLAAGFAAVRVPSLILEIGTAGETALHGLQGPAVQKLIPHAKLATLSVPEEGVLTMENHAALLAPLILEFLGK